MDRNLTEELSRSMFRFKKIGMIFPPKFGINTVELFVMDRISNAFDSGGSVCMSDIQADLFVTKPAISQTLNALEEKGYITREINKADRRRIVLALTPAGEEVMNALTEHIDDIVTRIISHFGEANMRQLLDLINRFANICEEVKNEDLPPEKGE